MSQPQQIAAALALCSVLFISSPAFADAKWPFRRVRPLDPTVAAFILRGQAASPAFRRLVAALERSDVIVHVEQVNRPGDGLAASTRFVTRAGGQRYVRITLYGNWSVYQTISLIGHELQHAGEVASAGWVVDQETCLELFSSIGHRTCNPRRVCYETDAAIAAGAEVLKDVFLQTE